MTIKLLNSKYLLEIYGGKNKPHGPAWGWHTGGFGAAGHNNPHGYVTNNGISVGNWIAQNAVNNAGSGKNPVIWFS
ncbi:MAG: hypothetical protein H6586_08875 [Flavobacteriales bacterium]|nr:hypothetical protein [Flavobacteriales bacterium]